MTTSIVAVVEGQGDEAAVRRLLQRWFELHQVFPLPQVKPLVAHGIGRILAPYNKEKQHGVEYWVDQAQRHRPHAILILVDADDECETPSRTPPGMKLGPWLMARAQRVAGHIPISVVVADRRFESWFLCPPCQQALHEQGLFQKLELDAAPRATGRTEARLRALMGRSYSKAADQVRLANYMPLDEHMALASRSFQKLRQELAKLCSAVSG